MGKFTIDDDENNKDAISFCGVLFSFILLLLLLLLLLLQFLAFCVAMNNSWNRILDLCILMAILFSSNFCNDLVYTFFYQMLVYQVLLWLLQ